MSDTPLGKLKMEFINNAICGNPNGYLIKIHIDKNFNEAAPDDEFYLNKWELTGITDLSLIQPFMYYMDDSLYMSESLYMGGTDLETHATSYNLMDITDALQAGEDFVVDPYVDPDVLTCYNIKYKYNGVWYQTEYVFGYKPIEIEGFGTDRRPCITLRNLRYRGVNESEKHERMFHEIGEDIYYMYKKNETIESTIPQLSDNDSEFMKFMSLMSKFNALIKE